jgi:hypothetical protein
MDRKIFRRVPASVPANYFFGTFRGIYGGWGMPHAPNNYLFGAFWGIFPKWGIVSAEC